MYATRTHPDWKLVRYCFYTLGHDLLYSLDTGVGAYFLEKVSSSGRFFVLSHPEGKFLYDTRSGSRIYQVPSRSWVMGFDRSENFLAGFTYPRHDPEDRNSAEPFTYFVAHIPSGRIIHTFELYEQFESVRFSGDNRYAFMYGQNRKDLGLAGVVFDFGRDLKID